MKTETPSTYEYADKEADDEGKVYHCPVCGVGFPEEIITRVHLTLARDKLHKNYDGRFPEIDIRVYKDGHFSQKETDKINSRHRTDFGDLSFSDIPEEFNGKHYSSDKRLIFYTCAINAERHKTYTELADQANAVLKEEGHPPMSEAQIRKDIKEFFSIPTANATTEEIVKKQEVLDEQSDYLDEQSDYGDSSVHTRNSNTRPSSDSTTAKTQTQGSTPTTATRTRTQTMSNTPVEEQSSTGATEESNKSTPKVKENHFVELTPKQQAVILGLVLSDRDVYQTDIADEVGVAKAYPTAIKQNKKTAIEELEEKIFEKGMTAEEAVADSATESQISDLIDEGYLDGLSSRMGNLDLNRALEISGMRPDPAVEDEHSSDDSSSSTESEDSQPSSKTTQEPVEEELEITTKTVPTAWTNEQYTKELSISGSSETVNWLLVGDNLPEGLSLKSSGKLMGTPTETGEFEFTVKASSEDGRSTTETFELNVEDGLSIVTESFPPTTSGDQNYTPTVEVSGGKPPYEWEIVDGELPKHLELDPNSGELTGTPRQSGSFTVSVRVTDTRSVSVERTLGLAIQEPVRIRSRGDSTTEVVVGDELSIPFEVSGGTKPYTFSIEGTLPKGVQFVERNPSLEGVVEDVGTYNLYIDVSDSNGVSSTCQVKIGAVEESKSSPESTQDRAVSAGANPLNASPDDSTSESPAESGKSEPGLSEQLDDVLGGEEESVVEETESSRSVDSTTDTKRSEEKPTPEQSVEKSKEDTDPSQSGKSVASDTVDSDVSPPVNSNRASAEQHKQKLTELRSIIQFELDVLQSEMEMGEATPSQIRNAATLKRLSSKVDELDSLLGD